MPRDRNKSYRREDLGRDGADCTAFTARLAELVRDLELHSFATRDTATGNAMRELADELRTAAHGPVSKMLDAHERATDEEGMNDCLGVPLTDYVTLGIKAPVALAAFDMAAE